MVTAFYASVAIAENFDPALADPRGNLTCLGNQYPLILPIIGEFNPNLVTMQQLCAKPQYDGGEPGQHVGGWCSFNSAVGRQSRYGSDQLQTTMSMVMFDISASAQVNTALANERVMLACRYKCFCSNGLDDLGTQPENTDRYSASVWIGGRLSYDLALDIVNDFADRTQKVKLPRPGVDRGSRLPLRIQDQGSDPPSSRFIGLDPANNITCRGNLPAFPLPLSENIPVRDYINDLQQMCANRLIGGSM